MESLKYTEFLFMIIHCKISYLTFEYAYIYSDIKVDSENTLHCFKQEINEQEKVRIALEKLKEARILKVDDLNFIVNLRFGVVGGIYCRSAKAWTSIVVDFWDVVRTSTVSW